MAVFSRKIINEMPESIEAVSRRKISNALPESIDAVSVAKMPNATPGSTETVRIHAIPNARTESIETAPTHTKDIMRRHNLSIGFPPTHAKYATPESIEMCASARKKSAHCSNLSRRLQSENL